MEWYREKSWGKSPHWREAKGNLRFLGHEEGVRGLQEKIIPLYARKVRVRDSHTLKRVSFKHGPGPETKKSI